MIQLQDRINRRKVTIQKLRDNQDRDIELLLGSRKYKYSNGVLTHKKIMSVVFRELKVKPQVVFKYGKNGRVNRKKENVFARFAYFYFCRKFTESTLKHIGRVNIPNVINYIFDHSSITHAENTFQDWIDTEKRTKQIADRINQILNLV